MSRENPILSWFLSLMLVFMTPLMDACHKEKQSTAATSNSEAPATTYARPSAAELYQLVAPIALFPDNLVAQVLASSTYPDQISSAEDWLKQNSSLKGNDLAEAVNQQSWDVSVKGMTQFPDVLYQMASNLSWTSALGDAYFNIPQDTMNAVQVMRQRASQSGNLQSTAQQTVTTQPAAAQQPPPPSDQQQSQNPQQAESPQATVVQAPPQTIVIQPAQPDVVYVPSYNPAVVYGAPVAVYPGYVAPPPPSTGAVIATGLISFGVGMAVGAAMSNSCCGWGWNSWGCGWHNSTVVYNRNTYISTSNTFVNRNNYYNRNVNNFNANNVNRNNFNRNNVNNFNANNVNRNNFNRNNINNNNYRANNFNNTARNSNFTTPNFGTQRNQPQFRNVNEAGGQRPGATNGLNNGMQNRQLGQAQNRQPVQPAADRQPLGQGQNRQQLGQAQNRQPMQSAANRQSLGQGQNRQQMGQLQNRQPAGQSENRTQLAQNQNRPNVNQAQRGFGQQERGTNSGAFSSYGSGGNARVNSARGQQSLSGERAGGGARSSGGARGGSRRR